MKSEREDSGQSRTLFMMVVTAMGIVSAVLLWAFLWGRAWEIGSSKIGGGEAAFSVDGYGGFILVFFAIALSGLVGLFCTTFFNSGIGQGRSREYKPASPPVPITLDRRSAYEEWRRF